MSYTKDFKSCPNAEKIINYLNSIEYCGYEKKLSNGLKCFAIDQKCTYDILHTDCECVNEFITKENKEYFTAKDLQFFDYSIDIYKQKTYGNGKAISNIDTKREYDKLFWNIFETLSYTGVMSKERKERSNVYKVLNKEIFNLLKQNKYTCLVFICHFVYKLVEDTDILSMIVKMKTYPTDKDLKEKFDKKVIDWIRDTGKRNKDAPQISKKIINPLYYLYELTRYNSNKLITQYSIKQSINELSYFRIHRRDKNKIPGCTRKENKNIIIRELKNDKLQEQKQKNLVKKWNKEFYKIDENSNVYKSEKSSDTTNCPNVHHIWPLSYFDKSSLKKIDPNIQENLILLSSEEHFGFAHKNGKTSLINMKNLKEILLIQKEKIDKYAAKNIGNYNKKRFYDLLCVIFNVEPIDVSTNLEVLDDYINEIIFNFDIRNKEINN